MRLFSSLSRLLSRLADDETMTPVPTPTVSTVSTVPEAGAARPPADVLQQRRERRVLRRAGLLTLVGAFALLLALAAVPSGPPRSGGAQGALAPTPSLTVDASPTGTPAQTPTLSPTPTDQPPASTPFLFDPSQWIPSALTTAFTWIFTSLRDALVSFLQPAIALNFLVQTPAADTYEHPVVLLLWSVVVAVADGALALIVLWGGYNAMLHDGIGARYHTARHVLPRVALAALAANLSLFFIQVLIDLNNALCGIPSVALRDVVTLLLNRTDSGLAFGILFLAFGVATLLLIVQMLVRLAMLDLLIVTAPLALICWALPQTQAWSRLWTRAFVSTVFVQFLQVLTLSLGGALIGIFRAENVFFGAMDLLIGLASVYLAIKVPGLLRAFGGPAAPNPLNDAQGVAGTALVAARLASFAVAL